MSTLRALAKVTELAAARPGWPSFRVGINTGPALVGNIGSATLRTFNAMGDAVTIAAGWSRRHGRGRSSSVSPPAAVFPTA